MGEAVLIIYRFLIPLTFLASGAFVITYHVLARWWETSFGKSLMTYQLCMTIILGLSTVQTLTGIDHPALSIFGLVVFAVVPWALIWRVVVLIRAQRKASK